MKLRPRRPRDLRYARTYIFGVVCPARDCGAALVLPEANTAAMTMHLEVISHAVAHGTHAIVIIDGAGWHTSDALVVPDNISLLRLLPYRS